MNGNSVIVNGKGPCSVEENILRGKIQSFNTSYSSIGQLLVDSMKKVPEKFGQIDAITDKQETFREMLDRTIKCALWMKKQGIQCGDVVSLCSHNHMDTFVPFVAATCIGAIFNPWDHEMNLQSARHFAKLSQPKILFANTSAVNVALEAFKAENLSTKVVVFGDHPSTIPFSNILKGHSNEEIESFECARIKNPRTTAVILFTSATTGPPKGVELSNYSLICHLTTNGAFNLSEKAPLWFSSMYWISGVLLTAQSIVSGARRIVCADFEEENTCKLIEKFQASWLFLGTSMANRLTKSGYLSRYDLSCLKCIFTGGAVLKRDAEEELRKYVPKTQVLQGYGMTEAGGVVCTQSPESTSGSCGKSAPNVQIKIIDVDTGKALGPNESGEICIKTPTLFNGYYKNPKVTKETIDADGWLHSGDLAYYNEKEEVFIVDRLKDIIKYRGHQVSPGQIENILYTHPAVLEAAVVSIPHPTDDEHPVAVVRLIPGSKVTAQELIDLAERNLMDHERLRGGVRFFESFPYTASGKIARRKLREAVRSTIKC